MSQPIRAIYEHGQLRLLDTVDLSEGQEIHLLILSERESVHAALSDLLVQVMDSSTDEVIDEEALMREIETGFRGLPPLSESMIKERREGP